MRPSLSLALVRAIKLCESHPAVRAARLVDETEAGDVTLELDIKTELPAAWRASGESPNGVREIEPVRFAFPAIYPLAAPKIILRRDFNRRHPHINPGPPDEPPVPCVAAGSPRELIQSHGIEGLVDQVADWLDKASTISLINPEQGWEPIRRDSFDDVMVVDGARIKALADEPGGSRLVQTNFTFLDTPERQIYVIDHRSLEPVTFASANWGRRPIAPSHFAGTSFGMIFWSGLGVAGGLTVFRDYEPETVTTMAGLRQQAEAYGCKVQFDALVDHLFLHADAVQKPLIPTPLAITFLVRRPHNIIGSGSPIELCSYVLHLTSPKDVFEPDRAAIRYCAIRETLGIEILRRASGVDESASRLPWTLLGCGSVGSKIALHAARRGFGPSLVVDRAHMEPHNFARHGLLPPPTSGPIGEFKAFALRDALAPLKQPADAEIADAVALLSTQEGRDRLAADDRALLNTTASLVIRDQLAFADWRQRPAIGEAHLLGAGRAAYAAFEGSGGNPNLSDLAGESYRLIAADPDLRRAVFDAKAQPITIGQGCSSFTFPMPDDRLSGLTAGLSGALRSRGFPADAPKGEIYLGKLADDGLSQVWKSKVLEPSIVVRGDAGIAVRISARVDRLVRDEIARRPGSETGGVIVGRFSHIGNAFHVVDVLPAPPDSRFSPHEFILGTQGLRAQISRLARETGNSLRVLGTWHNHLVASGPSGLDAKTAALLALSQDLPVLLLIALPGDYTALIAEVFGGATIDARSKIEERADGS